MSNCDHPYSSPTKSTEQLVTNLNENTECQNDIAVTENSNKVQKSINFSNNNNYESESNKTNDSVNPHSEDLTSQENETEIKSIMDFQCSDSQEQRENNELVDESVMDTSISENLNGNNCSDKSNKLDESLSINEIEGPCTSDSKKAEELNVTEPRSENDDDKTGNEEDCCSTLTQQDGNLNGVKNEIQKKNNGSHEEDTTEREGVEANNVATSPLSKTGDEEMENIESEMIDEDTGISIDESKMVKQEDVYGPGKRSRRSAIPKDYLEDSDLQEKLYEKSKLKKSFNARSSPKGVFKKLPASSKFNNLDLEKVTLPFKHGWRRELVLRNTFEEYTKSGHKKQVIPGDIYYYTPDGKKLRSMPQIIEFLETSKSPFTRENFTFFKQPISEPPYETVRNAGRGLNLPHHHKKRKKKSLCNDDDLPEDDQPFDKPEIVIERDSDGMVSPLVISSPPQQNVSKVKKSKFKLTPMRPVQSIKQNIENVTPVEMIVCPKTEPVIQKKVLTAEDVLSSPLITEEMLMKDTVNQTEDITEEDDIYPECTNYNSDEEPPSKKYKPTARKSTTQKVFRSPFRNNIRSESGHEALCSLNCPGQENIPPDLHCSVCLCLFHPQCVNYQIDSCNVFVCLRCSDPDQLKERLNRTKGRQKSTLTAMLSKPPLISTAGYKTIDNVKIKQEPKDDDDYGKASGQFSSDIQNGGMEQQTTGNNATDSNTNTTGVTGETLGSLRSVLDKRTTTQNIPSFLANPTSNIANFQSFNMATSQIVPNSKLSYSSIPSVPGPASTRLISATLLPILRPGQLLSTTRIVTSALNSPPLLSNFTNVSSIVQTNLPKLSSVVTSANKLPVISSVYSAVSANLEKNSPQISSLQPPKLIAAPTVPAMTSLLTPSQGLPVNSQSTKDSKSGQLLTLPTAVTKRLNLTQPLALKINNMQVIVPPSSFLHTTEGLRVFLPRNTFPVGTGETTKVSVTVYK
ncbi:hypothetical protein KUTeg_013485 [Tegillarca granosa]|uniref:MBD domain-containing protein n=1 Tax=Tegillarca granosa TaxID=220873 RepID=A0ABQ9EW93_TEGGR|nr:hypothetical protein KUTeg_013485 [Tegillarca granosa]